MRRMIWLAALLPLLAGCVTMERLEQVPGQMEKLLDPAESAVQSGALEGTRLLTGKEAEKAALDHAGLTEEQVSRLRTDYDREDGKLRIEVEFHHGGWEYSYEIDGETGRILSWEKEPER